MFHYDENENETDSGSQDNKVNFWNSKFKIFIVIHYEKNEFGTDYGADPQGERNRIGPSTLATEGLNTYKEIHLYKYFSIL